MIRARVFAICCGYEDADDLDDLRSRTRRSSSPVGGCPNRSGSMFAATLRTRRVASRCLAYSVHVTSSTPGAAIFFRSEKLARKTSTLM